MVKQYIILFSLSRLKYQGASCYEIDSEEKAELDIKCLQILRALIYNRIILIDREDMDRNPKKFRRCISVLFSV